MKNIILIVFLASVFAFPLISQKIMVDMSLKQDAELFQVQEPLKLWLNFLSSNNDEEGARFWNETEVNQYGKSNYFLLNDIDYFEFGNKLKSLQQGTTVLSISKTDSLYKITSQLQVVYNDSNTLTPFIFHVYAGRELKSGELKLYNPLSINIATKFQTKNYKNITYIFPEHLTFDKSQVKKQQSVLEKISLEFKIPLEKYSFVFTENRDSYFSLFGYDFNFQNIGQEYPSGKADSEMNSVYSYGCGFYYPHELIHLMINNKWKNSHLWFNEGFATYFGKSRGKDLDWHLQRIKDWLMANPDVDLNNLLVLRNLDDVTSFHYALGGFFIKIAYEKGGANLVEKLMESGLSDENFYDALESHLGIHKQDINTFVRAALNN